jgi:hypothetical protein
MVIVRDTSDSQLEIWAEWLDDDARDRGRLLRGALAYLEGLRAGL